MSISSDARPRAFRRRVAAAAAVATTLVAAAPAAAEPVKAGPALPDELAVLSVGGAGGTPAAYRSDQAAIQRFSTTDGAYRGRVLFPSAGDTPITVTTTYANAPLSGHVLKRSVDGRSLTFTGLLAPSGENYQDASNSAAVRVSADGSWTSTPFGAGYMTSIGQYSAGNVTVDGSRYWVATNTQKPLATIASGEAALTQIATTSAGASSINGIDIVDGVLHATNAGGVWRLAGALPTSESTTAKLEPVISLTATADSVFVDTDSAPGADTAYLTRGTRGLWKLALDGGEWKQRGFLAGDFSYVTARAVAGAVELYATNQLNTRLQKVVDTAESGATLAAEPATTLALAPSGVRFAGLAFAPGDGFTAEQTAYPATPPTALASATTIDTALEASPKASLTLDLFDPNSPASALTVTATSSNQTVLPDDKITLSGSDGRRTVTFDPATTGTANVTLTVTDPDGGTTTVTIAVRVTGVAPDPTSHYYSGLVDISAALDVGGDFFLGVSDEVNTIHLFKKGVSGGPLASFSQGFPGGETDFEAVTRFGDTIVWSGSHGNNRSGSARPERRFLAFTKITGSGAGVDLEWAGSYTRLWQQWKDWDAANGHGLGADYLKFNTATVPGLLPNAPNGFNVEGMTMAPGSETVAWFGMRAPTITGADGIERALILPVGNIDELTDNAVDAELGAPILLDLGGRSIRDIAKNAHDEYLITAGTGDTDDSLKNWALYTWDGNPDHDPVFVNELPTDESAIGAWEGIAEVPDPLVPGSRALLTADSGDTGLGKSYGQYVTLGEPVAGPASVTGVTATAKPGALDISWDEAERATRYYVTVKNAAGRHAPGSPLFATGTSATLEGLTAGTEYTVAVRAENVATRSASGQTATATPTQGERIATTTTIEYVTEGGAEKLIATISDPNARGTVEFYNGSSRIQDALIVDPVPGQGYTIPRVVFPVVDGKAEVNLGDRLQVGISNLSARFTTANAENYQSSQSEVRQVFKDYRPLVPGVEIVSVTGDLRAGGRVAIKAKLNGFTAEQLYTDGRLSVEFSSRVNGSQTKTRLTGDTPDGQYGSINLDENGVATFTTTSLAAGEHRISAWLPNYSQNYADAISDEIPVRIAAAAEEPAPAPEVKRPRIGLSVSGERLTSAPLTLTARLSDPTMTGTVQFFHSRDTRIGTPVPVVDGVATWTGTDSSASLAVHARFEPDSDRDTTASAVSLAVPVLRGTTAALPFGPPAATATTLELVGERVLGAPLAAKVRVTPQASDPLAARSVNGYVELLDRGTSLGIWPIIAGETTADLSALGGGEHAIEARYVPADETRALPSAASAEPFELRAITTVEGDVGGSVPATLALTLGAPASFGAFTPGVARDYVASTTATVLSTAGDATLTVADPSATATGHLVYGAFSLAAPLLARTGDAAFAPLGTLKTYAGPVANDVATVDFQQSIGANDALRTGSYAKTLTFTLSTTTP